MQCKLLRQSPKNLSNLKNSNLITAFQLLLSVFVTNKTPSSAMKHCAQELAKWAKYFLPLGCIGQGCLNLSQCFSHKIAALYTEHWRTTVSSKIQHHIIWHKYIKSFMQGDGVLMTKC